jgi:hypothetical protein
VYLASSFSVSSDVVAAVLTVMRSTPSVTPIGLPRNGHRHVLRRHCLDSPGQRDDAVGGANGKSFSAPSPGL